MSFRATHIVICALLSAAACTEDVRSLDGGTDLGVKPIDAATKDQGGVGGGGIAGALTVFVEDFDLDTPLAAATARIGVVESIGTSVFSASPQQSARPGQPNLRTNDVYEDARFRLLDFEIDVFADRSWGLTLIAGIAGPNSFTNTHFGHLPQVRANATIFLDGTF